MVLTGITLQDENGKLAPKFWVYHREWYWYGNLSFGSGDSRPDMNTQLQYQNKLVGTNEWYGDVAFSDLFKAVNVVPLDILI